MILPNKSGVFLSGTVYVEDENGNWIDAVNRNLNEDEQNLIIDLLDYALNTNGAPLKNRIKLKGSNKDHHIFIEKGSEEQSLMSKLIYYGPDKVGQDGKTIKQNPRRIYFSGGKLYFGEKSIPVSEIKTSTELKEFLADLRLNVNKNLLSKKGKYVYPVKVVKDNAGNLELEYGVENSYEDYLLNKEVIALSLPTKDSNMPKFEQGHVKFENRLINDVKETAVEKKEKPIAEEPSEETEFTEATFEDIASGNELLVTRQVGDLYQEIKFKYENGEFKATSLKNNGENVEVSAGVKKFMDNLTEELKSAEDLEAIKQTEVYIKNKVEFKKETVAKSQPVVSDETKTPIEGLNERLDNYGNARVVLSDDFNEGARPKGRLNAFKSAITKVADNLIVLGDLNLSEFDFLTSEDKARLDALRPLAEELRILNMNDISLDGRRTVAVEKRYAQLTNQLANEFVDIVGKHVEQQLDKAITSSKPKLAVLESKEAKPTEEQGFSFESFKPKEEVKAEQTIKDIFTNWQNDVEISSKLQENGVTLEELYDRYNSDLAEAHAGGTTLTQAEFMDMFKKFDLNC